MGSFLEYDMRVLKRCPQPVFMRFKVTLNIRIPFKRRKRVVDDNGESKIASVKYEKLIFFLVSYVEN